MKQLEQESTTHTDWNKGIVADLSFIKKYLRYPMRKSRWIPILFWSLFFILIVVLILSAILDQGGVTQPVVLVPVIIPFIIVFRYVHSLRFVKVTTPFYLDENVKALERFLTAQQLLTYRHPEAPEVFQILSRNISAGKEDREILIFIADDKRILLNSHFTRSGWSLSTGKNHVDEMARMLVKFIRSGDRAQYRQGIDPHKFS
ncbi:MAG TPA: hypothetical protein VL098_01175 [Flavipsychrobacter sp.]|nr:hypothetical protein [Flavipsychrobacter sp.]